MRSLAVLGLLAVASLVSPTAGAQPVRACPPGQAVQALDPGGKVATCIPVPAPVDLGAVNAAISAEATARAAGDQNLNGRVDAESVQRMQADQDIRDSLVEHGISGRWSVVGQGTCYRAPSAGFSTNPEFMPVLIPGATLQPQTFTFSGIRTVNGNHMTGSLMVYNLNMPATFFASTTNFNSGGGSVNRFDQDFTWTLDPDGTLTLTGSGSHGTITQGGTLVGAALQTTGAPPLSGMMSKDGRMVVMTNAGMQVEHSLVTPIGGTTSDTPRICVRVQTMYKLPD
jgi:hypothetical protein